MQLWSKKKVGFSSTSSQHQEPRTPVPFAIGSPLKNQVLASAMPILLHVKTGFGNQETGTVIGRLLKASHQEPLTPFHTLRTAAAQNSRTQFISIKGFNLRVGISLKALILQGAEFMRIPRHQAQASRQSAREWKMLPLTELKHKELHAKKLQRGQVHADGSLQRQIRTVVISVQEQYHQQITSAHPRPFHFFLMASPRIESVSTVGTLEMTPRCMCAVPSARESLHFSSSVPRNPKRSAGTQN